MDKHTAYIELKNRCLTALADEICPPVFGEGSLDARLVLIGEAPGDHETRQGRPFVGKAGQNLNGFLEVLGLKREEIYITNMVKVRPTRQKPGSKRLSNRPPTPAEVLLHRAYLLEELAVIRPEIIVTLGNTPLRGLTGDKKQTVGLVHGTLQPLELENGSCGLFALYHPASIIYNRSLAEVYACDLQALAALLKS